MRRRLIVNWHDAKSRGITPVAELLVGDDGDTPRFEFGYLEGARDAARDGFTAFAAFSDMRRRYVSDELFPFFRNRVLPTTRPDYLEHLRALGLDPVGASIADVLGRSGGRRATDRIETVLVPERSPEGRYVTHFFVRGIQHVAGGQEMALGLSSGAHLACTLDGGNTFNPRARKLFAGAAPIGFVPDYLVADVDALLRAGSTADVIVEQVNQPPVGLHYRVLCRLDAPWPQGFVPFRDPRLAPYADTAA